MTDSDTIQSLLPLSLKDICKLNIIFCLEDFPISMLSKLPLLIRCNLFLGLSICDRLHLEGTGMFDFPLPDLSAVNLPLSLALAQCHKNCKTDTSSMKNKIVQSLVFFDEPVGWAIGLNFDIEKALDCFQNYVSEELMKFFLQYIERFHSTQVRVVNTRHSHSDSNLIRTLVPIRFTSFVSLENAAVESSHCIRLTSVSNLLQYCKINQAAKHVTVFCDLFLASCVWNEYKTIIANERTKYHPPDTQSVFQYPPHLYVDPALPCLQNIMGTIETLVIMSSASAIPDIPYFLLYNIITSKQPSLKCIRVSGNAKTVLPAIAALTCYPMQFTQYPFLSYYNVDLVYPPEAPYLLKELSIRPQPRIWKNAITHLKKKISKDSCCLLTKNIIKALLHNLQSVSIDMNVWKNDEYSLKKSSGYETMWTASTLIGFMKQPQFVSLNVANTTVEECYDLVEAFLCTPATHEQKLCFDKHFPVGLRFKQTQSTLPDPPQLKQLLPSSNAQFKSLDVSKYNNKRFSKWLMQFCELKLKKLSVLAENINQAHDNIKVEIEHLNIVMRADDGHSKRSQPTIPDRKKLDLLISGNTSLKVLEFHLPLLHYHPNHIKCINHCLSKLLHKQNRRLETVKLGGVHFTEYSHHNMLKFFILIQRLEVQCLTD